MVGKRSVRIGSWTALALGAFVHLAAPGASAAECPGALCTVLDPVRSKRTCMNGETRPSETVVVSAYTAMHAIAAVSRRR